MKINLKKRKLNTHLTLGLVWIAFGIGYFIITSENIYWFGFGFIAIGFLDILHFLYDTKHQYLIIENGVIKKNFLYGFSFTNEIHIDHIKEIKRIHGDFILKSGNKTLKIEPDVIEKESLDQLIHFLKKLNLPPDKNFLTS